MSTAILLAALSFLAACTPEPPTIEGGPPLTVFAAASTTESMQEIAEAFGKGMKITVRLNFASSSILAQQIAAGADAHVFLSASTEWADFLAGKHLVADRRDLLSNRLVVVVPAESTLSIKAPEDLLSPDVEHIALGEPGAVPAGTYARQALQRLNLWDKIQPKLVLGDDVRVALMAVGRGEAEAGIVYPTDAAATKSVRVTFELDPALHEPIRYSLIVTPNGAANPSTDLFVEFIRSPQGADIFRKHGFGVL